MNVLSTDWFSYFLVYIICPDKLALTQCQFLAEDEPHPTMSESKPTSELLSAIQGADSKGLKDVTPVENPAAKHDMAMVSLLRLGSAG